MLMFLIPMDNERTQRIRNALKEPYPRNLLLTINEGPRHTVGIPIENITQDNVDGLLFALTTLSDREQKMIRLRFVERMTYAAIGQVFGISLERSRQLLVRAIRKLRDPDHLPYIKYGLQRCEERRKS